MIVKSLWFWRKGEDSPEMLTAWDEFTVDENWEGWQADCAKHLDAVRPDMSDLGYRYVDIRVDAETIEQMFYTNEIEGVPSETRSE